MWQSKRSDPCLLKFKKWVKVHTIITIMTPSKESEKVHSVMFSEPLEFMIRKPSQSKWQGRNAAFLRRTKSRIKMKKYG